MISALQNLNLLKLGTLFTLNFIGGFLIYASIFAAIGASINAMEDSQQFMTPIMILMVFSFTPVSIVAITRTARWLSGVLSSHLPRLSS